MERSLPVLWILDLDGVVWLGNEAIPGSPEAIRLWMDRGDRVIFTTNNSYLTVGQYQSKLAGLGLDISSEDIFTSAQAAASLLEPGSTALICAGPGVEEALSARDIDSIPLRSSDLQEHTTSAIRPSALVVGFSFEFDYQVVSMGAQAVRDGARLIATNDDPTYPTPGGLLAGTGALVASFATAAGVSPTVAGKPNRPMVDLLICRIGDLGQATMVGDRPSTDGKFAAELGVPFALVETGVTPIGAAVRSMPVEPDMVVPNLARLAGL